MTKRRQWTSLKLISISKSQNYPNLTYLRERSPVIANPNLLIVANPNLHIVVAAVVIKIKRRILLILVSILKNQNFRNLNYQSDRNQMDQNRIPKVVKNL